MYIGNQVESVGNLVCAQQSQIETQLFRMIFYTPKKKNGKNKKILWGGRRRRGRRILRLRARLYKFFFTSEIICMAPSTEVVSMEFSSKEKFIIIQTLHRCEAVGFSQYAKELTELKYFAIVPNFFFLDLYSIYIASFYFVSIQFFFSLQNLLLS